MKKTILLATALFSLGFMQSSCTKEEEKKVTTTVTPSLYDQVGGTTLVSDPRNAGSMVEKGRLTLNNVVDSSIFVIAGDPQMASYFPVLLAEVTANNTTGFSALSKNFTDFLCTATGAKNSAYAYTGKNMKAAHDPASNNRMAKKADAADFDKFVGDIGTGLAKNGVTSANNKALVEALVALLYTTKADVVQN